MIRIVKCRHYLYGYLSKYGQGVSVLPDAFCDLKTGLVLKVKPFKTFATIHNLKI